MRNISVILVAFGLLMYDHLLDNGPTWAIICFPVAVIALLFILNYKSWQR